MRKIALVIVLTLLVVAVGTVAASRPRELFQESAWQTVEAPSLVIELSGFERSPLRQPDRPGIPRIDSTLLDPELTAAVQDQAGRVQVRLDVQPDNIEEARQAAEQAGGVVTGISADGAALQVWLPVNSLPALAAQPAVDFVRLPERIVLAEIDAGSANSAGVAAANAAAWQAEGHKGAGVKIAIIDGGFLGYKGLGSDLPANVVARSFIDYETDDNVDGTTPHGAACAEIIHDMAPAAELYLLKIATDVDLAEAVDYAISQDVDIISTSLTFVNATPGDGTGVFATMAQKAADEGILWVTAAGNYAETHWGGAFADGDGDDFLEFVPGQEINFFGPGGNQAYLIPGGTAVQASVRWNDWTAPDQDYNLYLTRWNSGAQKYEIVASSTNEQTSQLWQRPVERISYVTSGDAAIYGLAIHKAAGNGDARLELFSFNRELDERRATMSLGNLADVPQVLTVGALDVAAPNPLEEYSSQGPTNGPGGTAAGGTIKPDLAAFANVDTVSYGPGAFNGTSSAAPHVAGAAALIMGADPGKTPGQVRSFLADRAADHGVLGRDAQTGFGRLLLGNPLVNRDDFHNKIFLPLTR